MTRGSRSGLTVGFFPVPGFAGAHCEIDKNECDPDPCHYGTCRDGIAAFTCLCQPGYTGHLCDININECQSQPCKNGGTCQDRNNAYNCLCLKGTTGKEESPVWDSVLAANRAVRALAGLQLSVHEWWGGCDPLR